MSKKHDKQKKPKQPLDEPEIPIKTEGRAEEYLLKYLQEQKGYPGEIRISDRHGMSLGFTVPKWGFTIRNPRNGGVEIYEVHVNGVVWQTYPMRK